MARRPAQIVAFGGGGFSMESGNPLLDGYVLRLTGRARPRVCFLPSASGDADHYIVRFYRAFPPDRCEASHISLFRRERGCEDVAAHLLSQDLIYVGGGSVVSLLGVWRAHGIDVILREAWQRGVVLCGLSAGSLCWFSEAATGFHGEDRRVEGLGLLPWSNAVHYDENDGARRTAYHRFVGEGMPAGYAAENGAALHFVDERLHAAISSKPSASAYRVEMLGDELLETAIEPTFLGGQPALDGQPLVGVAA
jgi:peptidase E